MSKLKSPLISLGAVGTVGDTITCQNWKGQTIAREKPIPRNPKTLAQTYHRWLYQMYLARWSTFTPAQKQAYKSLGAPFKMPGLAYFLKEKLSGLPELQLYLHLDDRSGDQAVDSSGKGNNGEYRDTTPADRFIDYCRHIPNVGNVMRFLSPHNLHSVFQGTKPFTVCYFFQADGAYDYYPTLFRGGVLTGFTIHGFNGRIQGGDGAGNSFDQANLYGVNTHTGIQFFLAITYTGAVFQGHVNGVAKNTFNWAFGIGSYPAQPLYIGAFWGARAKFWLDEYMVFDCVLTQPELAFLASRKYPSA